MRPEGKSLHAAVRRPLQTAGHNASAAIESSRSLRPIREWRDVTRAIFDEQTEPRHEPAVLRGVAADWPAVAAARQSTDALRAYLTRLDNGARVRAFVGPAEMGGRFFYRPQFDGFNFTPVETPLNPLLAAILENAGREYVYMGSTPTAQLLPGFAAENPLDITADRAEPRIWIGGDSVVAPHFDESDNIACVVSGRRRFTLFPPDQVANLYVGPIDRTMAGQPASLVGVDNPDFDRFPRFHEALDHALVTDLEPGDAIYIPALCGTASARPARSTCWSIIGGRTRPPTPDRR